MDAFYAAVEIRDNPELAGFPLIIGSLPHERGVVATCSYEARVYGVRSAMSIKEAYRLCPNGIYMHPNPDKYIKASRQIREIWDVYTDIVENVSLDEGYLDVTHSAHLFGGTSKVGRSIKEEVLQQVGLTCSVGIGYSMMSAKIASEEDKPDGFFEIADADALKELIIDRNVRVIYGVGVQAASVLNKNGIYTVRDVLNNQERTKELLGKQGIETVLLANGADNRKVLTPPKSKSLGREHTFQTDISDFEYLRDALRMIARRLSFKIKVDGIYCKTITLKVTFANMKQITRSKSIAPTNSVKDIFGVASSLLDKVERRTIRLIGISLSGFMDSPAQQLSLFDDVDYKQENLEELILNLQCKYGLDKIYTAREKLARQRLNVRSDEIGEDSFNRRM